MLYVYLYVKAMLENEEGQDLIEYVLIAGLIALVCVAAITTAGTSIQAIWNEVATDLTATATGF